MSNTFLILGNFSVRLAGKGSTALEGRVEIYYNGQWGTVCETGFNRALEVLCKQLGFAGSQWWGTTNPSYGDFEGTGPVWLRIISCTGQEIGIHECNHYEWGETECTSVDDVGIRCTATPLWSKQFR